MVYENVHDGKRQNLQRKVEHPGGPMTAVKIIKEIYKLVWRGGGAEEYPAGMLNLVFAPQSQIKEPGAVGYAYISLVGLFN